MNINKSILLFVYLTISSTIFSQTKVKEVGIGLTSLNVFNVGSYSLNYRWGQNDKLYTVSGGLNVNSSTSDNNSTNTTFVLDTLYGSGTQNAIQNSPYNINFNIGINSIKLKNLTDKFGYFYGFGLGLGLAFNKYIYENTSNFTPANMPLRRYETIEKNENSTIEISPNINIPIGVFYKFNNAFRVYAQLSPSIYYSYSDNTNSSNRTQTIIDNGTIINTNIVDKLDGTSKRNSFGINGVSNWNTFFTFVYRWEK